ncbi:hypothetical protein [Methylorubrum extorquens]
MDLREYGRELGMPGSVSPEVLAERFQRMAVSVSERWPAGSEHRSRYLAGVRAQTRMDIDLTAKQNPLYRRFLSHLLSLFEKGEASIS